MLRMTSEYVRVHPCSIVRGCFLFNASREVLVVRKDFSSSAFILGATPKNRAMYDHFVNGVPWEETGIIDEVLYLRNVKSRENNLPYPRRDDVLYRYRALDGVFEDIKAGKFDENKGSPINVAIGRDNEIFFCGNGWHRLWICQHLAIESIPCRIVARHVDSAVVPTYVKEVSVSRYFIGKWCGCLRQALSKLV